MSKRTANLQAAADSLRQIRDELRLNGCAELSLDAEIVALKVDIERLRAEADASRR